MKRVKCLFFVLVVFGLSSCSKEEIKAEGIQNESYLKFNVASEGNSKVLYSNWLKSQFPESSTNNSEFFQLPFIKNDFFNPDTDLMLVYAKRNHLFNLPVTIAESQESYSVALIPIESKPLSSFIGVFPRIRVTSLDLKPLQNIFFRANAESQLRVVIIPGEKLLNLTSKNSIDFKKLTYQELVAQFDITD